MRIVTADIMRELDRRTIEDLGIPGAVLMENAGRGATDVLLEHFQEWDRGPVTIVCGAGNNGGDGFVVARCLSENRIPVRVFTLVPPERYQGDAGIFFRVMQRLQIPCRLLGEQETARELQDDWRASSCIVDAVFGTGLSREVEGLHARAIENIGNSGRPVLSLDIPSGIQADNGRVLGTAVRASWTATFGLPKRGLYLYPGASHAGIVRCVPIGIPRSFVAEITPVEEVLDPEPCFRKLRRRPDTHKGTYGHLLVVSGSAGKTGAACLCSESALRCGAGLVTLGIPETLHPVLEGKLTEVMTLPLADGGKGVLKATALEKIHTFLEAADGFVIGPGLGIDAEIEAMVRSLWQEVDKPMVWDADALTLLARNKDLRGKQRAEVIVTPHPGEMSRLLAQPVSWVQENRVEAARSFAEAWGVVTVLKGARTLIAGPDGALHINLTGNAGMAAGGMGDVLSGMIGALLLQGFGAMEAASFGVWLHGRAGDTVASSNGPVGFLASEVMRAVPGEIRQGMDPIS
jgi:NAD(P)H-hydrate epimerase